MATIDTKKNLIRGKIVYYGPGLCGKTTNLEYVNRAVPNTDEMMSLATEGDRTIFFDYLPMDLGKIRGISTNFKLYTVPGQVRYNLTRKMVLKNVDGVVFVADSQRPMEDANIESLQNLYDNLYELGIDADDVPIVLQYNKRDLPNLLTREELDDALNQDGYPVHLASAVRGDGVMETLKEIMQIVFAKLTSEFGGKSKKAKKTDEAKQQSKKTKKAKKKDERKSKAPKAEKEQQPADKAKKKAPAPPPVPPKAEPAPAPAKPAAAASGLTEDQLAKATKDQNKELARLFEKNVDKVGMSFASTLEQKLAKVRKEIEGQIKAVESSTKKELDRLRKDVARLGDQQPAAADGKAAGELGEKAWQTLTQAVESLPTKRDFRMLRQEITGLEEKVKGAAPDAAVSKDLGAAAKRAVEEALEGLPSKRDFQVLRKEIALLEERVKGSTGGGGASAQALGDEARRAVERATGSLASKSEIDRLRKDIAALADSTKAAAGTSGGAERQALGELQRAVVDALKRLGQQTQRIEQAMTTLGSELRGELAKGAAPPAAEPPAPAKPEPEPEPEPEKPEPEPDKKEAEPEPKPEPEPEKKEPDEKADEVSPKPGEPEAEKEEEAKADEFADDPRHKNAKRVAKVMVSDLKLYYAADVDEGVKNGDLHERLKNQLDDMRTTYEARVPEDVRAERDYLALAIDELIEKKRKELGID